MKLVGVRIRRFRNIIDSEEVDVSHQVTCLVGKNESGKTAFLHALYRLNPARPNVEFSVLDHYPAWMEKRDRQSGEDLGTVMPVEVTFSIDNADKEYLSSQFGNGVINNDIITIGRNYNNRLVYTIDVSEKAFVEYVIGTVEWPRGTKTDANKCKTITDLYEYSQKLHSDSAGGNDYEKISQVIEDELNKIPKEKNFKEAVWEFLQPRIPKFLYFSEYSKLPYSVPIRDILTKEKSLLNDGELTARALLMLAATEKDYLVNADYERRKRELENVANLLTQEVLEYWSQNPELRVSPDITQKNVKVNGIHSVIDELKIRIWDQRHCLSLPFDEHSTGFQWFFSFLASFSEFESEKNPVVILLDEPALGLHARAQKDFLRFIEGRLAVHHQVVYSTHSPFMIQPGKLDRVRLVEDRGKEEGAKVTAEVTTTDPDTLFPLQGALGYDLAQHLFIAPHNLVVEGTSDYTYLKVMSDYFKHDVGSRTYIDDRWSIVPVGGADLIPTFVALLGNHLDVTVLIDSRKRGHQKLSRLVKQGILEGKRIIDVGIVLEKEEADIEDLFDPSEYMEMFNNAFETELPLSELQGQDPIVRQITRAIGEEYNHGKPADYFLGKRDYILPTLSKETLDRFESLFGLLNSTLIEK